MLAPPTDRLHKFLAIGGLVLLATGISIPIQKYQEAEVQRIEAMARVRENQYAYQHFADQVNRMIRIHNDAVSHNLQGADLAKAKAKGAALTPEAKVFGKETEKTIVEMTKQIELAVHLKFIQNLWFGVGFASATLGAIAAFFGFRQWLRQPKNER